MERREHYHPEDIEHLLHERSFDELLEEERAFVLRHLSGRNEYEAMRALLVHVRDDDRKQAPPEADPAVRDAVMAAFRAEQKPQWTIWLNSLGGLLWPRQSLASSDVFGRFWRPALALTLVSLLIVAGIWIAGLAGDTIATKQVAELKVEGRSEPGRNEPPTPRATLSTAPDLQEPTVLKDAEAIAEEERAQASGVGTVSASASENVALEAPVKEAVSAPSDAHEQSVALSVEAEKMDDAVSGAGLERTSHVVTEAELSMNQSVANASTRARKAELAKGKVEQRDDRFGSLAEDPALIGLVTAGW